MKGNISYAVLPVLLIMIMFVKCFCLYKGLLEQ